ncbi:hypothetical protein Bbelb_202010 [Branchiostoma belcheri]|nr:hypothetical protein Bbelb_202010 [Branchiostoma belcheri]
MSPTHDTNTAVLHPNTSQPVPNYCRTSGLHPNLKTFGWRSRTADLLPNTSQPQPILRPTYSEPFKQVLDLSDDLRISWISWSKDITGGVLLGFKLKRLATDVTEQVTVMNSDVKPWRVFNRR